MTRTYLALVESGARLLTSNLVVAELHASVVRARGAREGVRLLDQVYGDPVLVVSFATREIEMRAIDRWLRPFHDHRFSLTDAVSFELMREHALRTAFALDTDFAIAGFEMVPE